MLVVVRSQPALDSVPEAYHDPAAAWWGSLHFPRPCRHGPGGYRQTISRLSQREWSGSGEAAAEATAKSSITVSQVSRIP